MFIQIPIFGAFFSALRNAFELRGAPFYGWMRDLSAADSYHVVPILAGLTMFISQRLTTGAAADPTQRQMAIMMPIMMTFMFWNLPLGLNLYMLTSSLTSMAIQWTLQELHRRPPPSGDATPLRV